MKYEDRRRALHRFARAVNPPPFDPTPEGKKAAQVYGDFGARCAPFLDEVVAAARGMLYAAASSNPQVWHDATDHLFNKLADLDAEASRNPDDSLTEDRRIIFASLEGGDGG